MSRKAKSAGPAPRGVAEGEGKSAPGVDRVRWTAAGAARAARDARIATAAHLRSAEVAQMWELTRLMESYQVLRRHLGAETRIPPFLPRQRLLDETATTLLFGGAGLTPPFPAAFDAGARAMLDRRAADLDAATVYVLSPPMCDVGVAAAQTLSLDDFALLDHDDLPSPTGLLMLAQPVLVRAVNGDLGDDRAFVWTTPAEIPTLSRARKKAPPRPGVRCTNYHDAHGPVRPDSFRDMAALAAARGTPLPPLIPDSTKTYPFRPAITDRLRAAAEHLAEHARADTDGWRELNQTLGAAEGDQIVASFDYRPGDEINDDDDTFTLRFLYAFWRLCEQRIVDLDDAPTGHSAQVLAARAGVPAQVRVATLRAVRRPASGEPIGGRDWQHQWVVRMHKVRQWYPSQERHKILYRGPYVKGPADKPLLGGEVVRSLNR